MMEYLHDYDVLFGIGVALISGCIIGLFIYLDYRAGREHRKERAELAGRAQAEWDRQHRRRI